MSEQVVDARRRTYASDVRVIAGRSLRALPRDLEAVVPPLVLPIFMFVVTVGLFGSVSGKTFGLDYTSFALPAAVVFGITGISRASAAVLDISTGYLQRLLLAPIRRSALLFGMLVADLLLSCVLSAPVLLIGLLVGVPLAAGLLGGLVFIVLAGMWGVALSGLVYAIAFRTGNPSAVAASFPLFFPFTLLTTSLLPRSALSGWFDFIAGINPTTYVLAAMRSLLLEGWDPPVVAAGFLAIVVTLSISTALALLALRGRLLDPG